MQKTGKIQPNANRTRGRPIASRDVRITAEFHKQPDLQKLARAFIAVAVKMAENHKPKPCIQNKGEAKGDTMP